MVKEHLYTLHHTYTGQGCAICGKEAQDHQLDLWLVNGEKVEIVATFVDMVLQFARKEKSEQAQTQTNADDKQA